MIRYDNAKADRLITLLVCEKLGDTLTPDEQAEVRDIVRALPGRVVVACKNVACKEARQADC